MSLSSMSDAEILKVANPIMDNLMEAVKEINHEKYTRDFTERLKKIVTKETCEKMCNNYLTVLGYFQKREFVAVFRRKGSVAIVWKQSCSKTTDEYVAEMVLVDSGGKYFVDHAVVF